MSDPSVKLQAAIVARLKGDAAVSALIGVRVYDEIPTSATYPYVNISGGQVVGDDDDCAETSEITTQLHVWTRPPSAGPKGKEIAGAVRTAMRPLLVVSGFENLSQEFQQIQWLDDPDGLTKHAVVEHRFIIAHP